MKRVLTSLLFLLSGCYGRPNVTMNSQEFYQAVAQRANLKQGQPAVITFSALWCHPCREEIDSLNQANQEFGGLIQFRGFLVEGEEKGSTIRAADVSQFTSFTGASAEYMVTIDPQWQLFDMLHEPQGHSLPTMVILDQAGNVEQVIQQSLDYQTQLRPLLLALARGQNIPIQPKPTSGQVDSIANWVARPEVAAQQTLIDAVTVSWQSGMRKYSFTADEMPFASGQITFSFDGTKDAPLSAKWLSDTPTSVCTLNVVLNPDGSLASSTGVCRQK